MDRADDTADVQVDSTSEDVGGEGGSPGDVELTPILLGLGVDELSVSPALVPRVKSAIRNVSREECEKLVEEALLLDSPAAILERSLELARERYGELLG